MNTDKDTSRQFGEKMLTEIAQKISFLQGKKFTGQGEAYVSSSTHSVTVAIKPLERCTLKYQTDDDSWNVSLVVNDADGRDNWSITCPNLLIALHTFRGYLIKEFFTVLYVKELEILTSL